MIVILTGQAVFPEALNTRNLGHAMKGRQAIVHACFKALSVVALAKSNPIGSPEPQHRLIPTLNLAMSRLWPDDYGVSRAKS